MQAGCLRPPCASSLLTPTGREKRSYCAGFISGVEEAVRVLQEQHKHEASVCLPEGVSAKKLSDAFKNYSVTRQQQINKPVAAAVLEALSDAWPCKEAE